LGSGEITLVTAFLRGVATKSERAKSKKKSQQDKSAYTQAPEDLEVPKGTVRSSGETYAKGTKVEHGQVKKREKNFYWGRRRITVTEKKSCGKLEKVSSRHVKRAMTRMGLKKICPGGVQ